MSDPDAYLNRNDDPLQNALIEAQTAAPERIAPKSTPPENAPEKTAVDEAIAERGERFLRMNRSRQ